MYTSIPQDTFIPGAVCIFKDHDGQYGVLKILALNDTEAHVKVYSNKYIVAPEHIDTGTLTMKALQDGGSFGIGHVPLERSGFDSWLPVRVGFEPLLPADLEGYHIWEGE